MSLMQKSVAAGAVAVGLLGAAQMFSAAPAQAQAAAPADRRATPASRTRMIVSVANPREGAAIVAYLATQRAAR